MLERLRKQLLDDYKHKTTKNSHCVICGRKNTPVALHVIEFYHDENISTPQYLIPMTQSRGILRGSVPICDHCCPPCSKCSLPIATRFMAKIKDKLKLEHPDISFVIGNGFCKDHIHLTEDIKGLFKNTRLRGLIKD